MTRLLRETLPHLALGAALAGLALVPWPWLRLPLVVLFAALVREHAQVCADKRYQVVLIPRTKLAAGPPITFTRGSKVAWPPGWWRSARRWADVGECVAGAAVIVGGWLWLA